MIASHPLLARRPARAAPAISLLQSDCELTLAQGRVHEASGPARRSFAIWLAANTKGPILWVAPQWQQEHLNSDGVCDWVDPARLVFVTPKRGEDILWTMEEVLRSGAVSLAVADLPALPGLTSVRRLHLAAETGAQAGQHIPLGLLVTPGDGGAPGVETRWHLAPRHSSGQEAWRLQRLRARTAPRKAWDIHRPSITQMPQIKTA